MVTYKNPPAQIEGLIRSLQGSSVLRAVAVFDNSPDDSLRAAVIAAGAQYLRCRKNIGFGAGHNRAFAALAPLGATYHLIVNPDIDCAPHAIAALLQFMEEHPEIGLAMPRILNSDGTEQHLCKQFPSPIDLFVRRFLGRFEASLFSGRRARYHLRHLDLNQPREIPCLSGCFMFLRRAAMEQAGLFDERYFLYMEDVDFCRRIGAQSKTALCPSVAVHHAYARGSYKDLRLLGYHLHSAFLYFSKWGWFFDTERKLRNQRTAIIAKPETSPVPGSDRAA